jgi:hypothetical protein
MLIVAGALLLQLSSFAPRDLPNTRPAEPPAQVTAVEPRAASAQPDLPSLRNIRLTNLNFDNPDSGSLKTASLNIHESPTWDTESLASIHVPEKSTKPSDVRAAESYPRRAWFLLGIVQHGAAAFDAYSTRYAVGHGAIEEDPLMRPFAHSPSIYAVSQISPTVLDFLGRRMLRSENGLIRHMWWLPQSVSTAVYIFSGVHNFGVASLH